jgi:hypothetical protein
MFMKLDNGKVSGVPECGGKTVNAQLKAKCWRLLARWWVEAM